MRVFIAIDIERHIKDRIDQLQRQLMDKADFRKGDVKWVQPENMHLTLKFLGQTRDEDVAGVCKATEKAVAEKNSFDLEIKSVGTFGGKAARVLWVGLGEGSEKLTLMQQDIEHISYHKYLHDH